MRAVTPCAAIPQAKNAVRTSAANGLSDQEPNDETTDVVRGMSTEDAVRKGIAGSAGTVTAAAVVMVLVFSVFATLSFIDFKEMGVGLAVAILIDATIIRGVLLPATMKLLGDWNWWLPKSLEWLPQVKHESEASAPAAGQVEPARA